MTYKRIIFGISLAVFLSFSSAASAENNQLDILGALNEDGLETLTRDEQMSVRGERFDSILKVRRWRNNNCGKNRIQCLNTIKKIRRFSNASGTIQVVSYEVPWYKKLIGTIHTGSGVKSY